MSSLDLDRPCAKIHIFSQTPCHADVENDDGDGDDDIGAQRHIVKMKLAKKNMEKHSKYLCGTVYVCMYKCSPWHMPK